MYELSQIKEDLQTLSPQTINQKYFLEGDAWYFEKYADDGDYEKFKTFIAKKLGISEQNVGLAGSAKVGYSFNPNKNLKKFDDESDIDLIIVSETYFRDFWWEYLKNNHYISQDDYHTLTGQIFRKFLCVEPRYYGNHNTVFTAWLKLVNSMKKDIQVSFGIYHKVNYRIYESWDAVTLYHINSIRKLQQTLLNQ